MIELVVERATSEALVTAAYDRYRDELQGYLLRVTRDPEAAADLAQEAFLKLLVETRDRQAPDNVRAWLYRVATNAAVSRGRRLHTANVFEDRIPRPEPEDGPEEACLRKEAIHSVERLLAGVRPDERRALLLAADGVDGMEIALAIGRTHGATRTLLHRARTRLRDQAVLQVA
jgi:RNA polymerase sigma-70 factor (ECF subfamily)